MYAISTVKSYTSDSSTRLPPMRSVSSATPSLVFKLAKLITLSYVNGTLSYPMNPNGSQLGITGLTNTDGRITIMMPHPERVFRTDQNSWHPKEWNEFGPWYRMFANAYKYFN